MTNAPWGPLNGNVNWRRNSVFVWKTGTAHSTSARMVWTSPICVVHKWGWQHLGNWSRADSHENDCHFSGLAADARAEDERIRSVGRGTPCMGRLTAAGSRYPQLLI
jgi:hypothetical protein